MSTTHPGWFVWYDLNTTDPTAARAFYTAVMGWALSDFEGGDDNYKMFTSAQVPVGGVMPLPAEAAALGVPPHWLGYVCVDDLAATTRKAVQLGATLRLPPKAIPGVGSIAVFSDPQGAVIAVFQPQGDTSIVTQDTPGHYSWHELATSSPEAAQAFYFELFGWQLTQEMDMGPAGVYKIFRAPEATTTLGGLLTKPDAQPVSAWLYYVQVADLHAAITRVVSAGGQVVNGPMEVPGGHVAQCLDPQGGMFALHSSGSTSAQPENTSQPG